MEKERKTVNKKGTASDNKKVTKNVTPKKVDKKESKAEVKATKIKADKAKIKEVTKKNKVYYANSEASELGKFAIIILVIVIFVGAVYLCTRAFVTKDLFKKEDSDTKEVVQGEVNYDVAIVGNMLEKSEKEYYVVIYNASEGDYISDMSSLVYAYNSKESHLHMYTVDLSNIMNSSYYSPEEVNVNAKTIDEIKLGDITLIKVKKDKKGNNVIDKYIVDYSKMVTELGVTL